MKERFETFTVLINRISRNIRKIKNQEMAEYHLRSAHVSCLYYLYTNKVKEAGESAVVITLASKFSGTYQSATIAAEDYDNVYIVDSASAAMGSGILVELAFKLLDEGKSAAEIAAILEEEKKKIVAVC